MIYKVINIRMYLYFSCTLRLLAGVEQPLHNGRDDSLAPGIIMRSASEYSARLQILTAMIGAGILLILSHSESVVRTQPQTLVELGMALAGIGACLAMGAQMARRRSET